MIGDDITITSVSAEAFETPLHRPFTTSQGSVSCARGVAVHVGVSSGSTFRGESVPVAYVTGETIETVLSAVDTAGPSLIGVPVRRWRLAFQKIASVLPEMPSARCGLEMAVLQAFVGTNGTRLSDHFGGAVDSVRSDVTLPIGSNSAELAQLAWDLGIRTFKIKVGENDVAADLARVRAVRDVVPDALLRIDANQAFTVDAAVEFINRIVDDGAEVELFEQPVIKADLDGLAAVARRSPVPVFADESCRTPADAMRIAQTEVHGLNLKMNKNGIGGLLDIVPIARAANKALMIGCMLETRYSIGVALAIACGTGAFDHVDLDSHLLLSEPTASGTFDQDGDMMSPAS